MKKVENIVAKGEIACFEQFLLFFTMFSSHQMRQNVSIGWKGLNYYLTFKSFVVGTQKNRLNVMILLSTQSIEFK